LTFSLLVDADAVQLAPRQWPQASLTVGLAVCEAIEDFLDEPAIRLKWPNDVYVRRRKVCGILIELPPQQKQVIVIGIGINVNNSARHAPEDLQSSAIALCDAAQSEFALIDVLLRVLVRLQHRIDWIGRRDQELWAKWRERCLLTNRTVHLDSGTRELVGLCRGIDDEGALVIETVNQTERCFAGVITQF
jgi:BirA family biotin operon repressor/biotin-[acetyl-CoA-carboxylase] ligase